MNWVGAASTYQRLPFSFANRYKMVLSISIQSTHRYFIMLEPPKSAAIIEVSRCENGFTPQAIGADEF
ncbi:hypothetical protein O9929_00465 [Vibrio lentus]|nr:hypothetical protein [Vibrio lentus]